MLVAILADIHANLKALEAVLEDMGRQGKIDELWCLGDIVGYGPEPSRCIELLRRYNPICVAGNHDLAAIGKLGINHFNPTAARALLWTSEQLEEEDIEYLGSLPQTLVRGDFTLVHGSPRQPVEEYLLSPWEAGENFSFFSTSYCLVGHSHIPLVFHQNGQMERLSNLKLDKERLIINPGGVGQPRDGDPRASYVLYNAEEKVLYHFRVAYDIEATQRRMSELKLPLSLALRLSYGR